MPSLPWLQALRRAAGEVYDDPITRALYSTDASPYQIEPLAVVVPYSDDDVRAVLGVANEFGVPLLPRGGATSLAGQAVGRAIQIDFSKYLNRIIEINHDEQWARVQPGLVLDHLNGALAPHGLRFAPDVSPGNRATIGGMIGNNSCGAYSLRFGKTIDHVLELRVLLSDGSETTLRPLDASELAARRAQPDLEGACYRVVGDLAARHAGEIRRRFPDVMRRVGGYNLDAFVGRRPFNLCDLVVGSEGTLALVLEAKLRLVPRPAATGVALLEFSRLHDALDAVVPCLECAPVAVELIDRLLIDVTRRSLEYRHYLDVVAQRPGRAADGGVLGRRRSRRTARHRQAAGPTRRRVTHLGRHAGRDARGAGAGMAGAQSRAAAAAEHVARAQTRNCDRGRRRAARAARRLCSPA